MLLAWIFSVREVKRIALTILFRFNAMADKRHSSVTAGMPLFLILERLGTKPLEILSTGPTLDTTCSSVIAKESLLY